MKQLAKSLGIIERVKFLGYRNDVSEIYNCVDLFVFPSFREGLSLSLMEAMASGLPVICSKIRGNADLIEDGKGGYLINPNDINGFAESINTIKSTIVYRQNFGTYNLSKVKQFSEENVKKKMVKIYSEGIANER